MVTEAVDPAVIAGLDVMGKLFLSAPGPEEWQGLVASGIVPPSMDQDQLAVRHAFLFGGLRPGLGLMPPYESMWRGEGMVMGASTRAVQATYAQLGADFGDLGGTPPDHVGLEVGFLAYLLWQIDEANHVGDAAKAQQMEAGRQAFLSDHMLRWVPQWCQAVEAEDPDGFYGGLAASLREQLEGAEDRGGLAVAAHRRD